MIRRSLAAAALALWAQAALADPTAPPYATMRTLQDLQEQIAHGNASAQAAQPKLMAHIADGFLEADPTAWREPRNARAAVLFLLSGGKPSVIRTILERTAFPADLDRLLKGSLAYAEGEDEIARTLLDPIDPEAVPSALGAHVALVKANLFAERDAKKAIALFDKARLLAPGTLIEEAALRREIFVLVDAGITDKAMLLSRQYLRRFRKSTYADNFKQRFAALVTRLAASGDIVQLVQLDTVLNELPPAEARGYYLAIAKSATLNGKPAEARAAADKALPLTAKGSVEESRATLYRQASLILSDDPGAGSTALAALDPLRLSPDDRSLREAVLAVGAAIMAGGTTADAGAEPGSVSDDPVQATITRARGALGESARVLEASQP